MKKAIFSTEISLLKTTIERLLRRKASTNLTKIIRKTHPADIAMIMRGLNIDNQKNLFKLSPTFAYKAEILEELDESLIQNLLSFQLTLCMKNHLFCLLLKSPFLI